MAPDIKGAEAAVNFGRNTLAARRDAAHHRAARGRVAAAPTVRGGEHLFMPRGVSVGDSSVCLTFFHFFESRERSPRKSSYRAFSRRRFSAPAGVPRISRSDKRGV